MFKILVVEDDVDLNRAMCKYLTANGYRTTGCNNAEDAFEAISKNVFDIIISDIMMPHTDGFDFTETVRTTQKEIPILFVTARDDIYSKKPLSASERTTTWSNRLISTSCFCA